MLILLFLCRASLIFIYSLRSYFLSCQRCWQNNFVSWYSSLALSLPLVFWLLLFLAGNFSSFVETFRGFMYFLLPSSPSLIPILISLSPAANLWVFFFFRFLYAPLLNGVNYLCFPGSDGNFSYLFLSTLILFSFRVPYSSNFIPY